MARLCCHWRWVCPFYLQALLKRSKIEKPSSRNKRYRFSYSKKIPEVSKKNIQNYLREAGFKHVFKDLDDPATEAYVKDIAGAEVEIEFLTDDSVRNNKDKNVVIAGVVAQRGMPLEELTRVLKTFPVESHEEIRDLLVPALKNPNQCVLALYQRKELKQEGGGHWSPIAAYDAESDSFLILDVARFKYPPVWINASAFINSLQTVNIYGQSRGFIIIEKVGAVEVN